MANSHVGSGWRETKQLIALLLSSAFTTALKLCKFELLGNYKNNSNDTVLINFVTFPLKTFNILEQALMHTIQAALAESI